MYPRTSGHCASHHIPTSIQFQEEEDGSIAEFSLQQALRFLRENSIDLVKGDLILFDSVPRYRNDGVAIFDGRRIINIFDQIDEYGSLPPQFRVIEDNVPINYWTHFDDNTRGITHNYIVWFNHALVRDQCLANLQYGPADDGSDCVFTRFQYNHRNYRIIFDYTDVEEYEFVDDSYEFRNQNDLNKVLTAVRLALNDNNLIVFCTYSESYETSVNDHTLFVRLAPPRTHPDEPPARSFF